MKHEDNKSKLSRKPLHGKHINGKLFRWKQTHQSFSPNKHHQQRKKDEIERNITLKINEQSISFIAKNQQGSFISLGQDRSIDSFDKLFIGVESVLDLDENAETQEPNYSLLYRQFERLCKSKSQDSNDEHFSSAEEESKINKENSWEESQPNNIKLLRERLEEVKQILRQRGTGQVGSDPNISIRMLGANLSQIHEQEIQHDSSMHRMDPIQEEFIDFVSKGQGQNKINISKIEEKVNNKQEKKVLFKGDILKQTQEDEVVAMLENELVSRGQPQEESINEDQVLSLTKKRKKQSFLKDNYNQILSQLDDNDEKKLAASRAILVKRAQWVQSQSDKSQKWKNKEMKRIRQFQEILQDPYTQFSDQENSEMGY